MPLDDESVAACLRACGMSEEMTREQARAIGTSSAKLLEAMRAERRRALDAYHEEQKRIDRIDHLIWQYENE